MSNNYFPEKNPEPTVINSAKIINNKSETI